MTEPLRVAIVGCGYIAPFHAAAWNAIPDAEVVALVDPDPAAIARLRAQVPGARGYDTLAAALAAERLDLVDILSPAALHVAHARAALAAGLPTVCQKPLADDLAAARELTDAFARAGVPLAVHENHAFRPWFLDLAARHERGDLGDIRLLRLRQYDAQSPPQATNREAAHGVLLGYGIHLVDLALRLLGPPLAVDARTWAVNPEVRGESLAEVRLHYPGAEAQIGVGWQQSGLALGGVELLGSSGDASYAGTMTRGGLARWRVSRGRATVVDEVRDPDADYAASFLSFQRAVVAHLRGTGPLPQPATRNLLTLETVFAAYAAADSGRTVELPVLEERR